MPVNALRRRRRMVSMQGRAMLYSIDTVELFYAHALAIEREAAERYGEYAAYFADHGEAILGSLCRNLAGQEREHLDTLLRASYALALPVIDAHRYHWLDRDSPEQVAREAFYRLSNPRQLLAVALAAERRAQRFFRWVSRTSRDGAVRALARGLAHEEAEHVRWVRNALEYREPMMAWEGLLERGIRGNPAPG